MGFLSSLQASAAVRRSGSLALSFAASALLQLPLPAQTKLLLPETPLLPEHFAGWDAVASSGQAASGSLPLLDDAGLSTVVHEDGLVRTARANYTHGKGSGELGVQAMQFGDATGAVAAFTFLRGRSLVERPAEPGARNHMNVATGPGETLLREGVSLLVLEGPVQLSPADLHTFADTLPKIGGPKGLPPLLPTYLPSAGLVPGSVQYAVGPAAYKASGGVLPPELIGFDKAGEAATGSFNGRDGNGKLTLLLLPTPQIAGDRGRAIESWLNGSEGHQAALGTVKLRRIGPMLALATGAFTAQQAESLVGGIHLRTELTWNKSVPPEFHVEVRKTASLLTSILVFSGVGALAALLLGSFLGFGRAYIRVLMGKPAASEPEFLRLDLRSGTPAEK